jgi:hypothetical protein
VEDHLPTGEAPRAREVLINRRPVVERGRHVQTARCGPFGFSVAVTVAPPARRSVVPVERVAVNVVAVYVPATDAIVGPVLSLPQARSNGASRLSQRAARITGASSVSSGHAGA